MNRNITADTTIEQITGPVRRARLEMKIKAIEFADESGENAEEFFLRGEALVSLAQNVASAEALMTVQLQYLSVCVKSPEHRLQTLFDIISRGADDSWSGRKNDSKRSEFDAVRSWASDQADRLRYEA